MTLSRKMVFYILALTGGLIVLGLAPIWGLLGLKPAIHYVYDEYNESRMVDAVSLHVAAAKALLAVSAPDTNAVAREIQNALDEFDTFVSFQDTQESKDYPCQDIEFQTTDRSRKRLRAILARLQEADADPTRPWEKEKDLAELGLILADLHHLADEVGKIITEQQQRVATEVRRAIPLTAALAGFIIITAVFLNISHYRSVIGPLLKLRESARKIASGRFSERVHLTGHGEFSEVAADFNRMTEELESLYRDLEDKVRAKSKELVRSERLASVGFLAAGLAHEINNPLNIISGHAELSLNRLQRAVNDRTVADAQNALQIICEESFRCKGIIQKLLSLSRMGDESREPLSVAQVADEVAAMIKGVKQYRNRKLKLHLAPAETLTVRANGAELKQVLLNLIINALEAVEPHRGEVHVNAQRRDGWVELAVQDNGRGITPEAMDHIFEPFFTDRQGSKEPGTGLGLSIANAIVEAHGGRIRAESDGPGQGSRFIVELPASE